MKPKARKPAQPFLDPATLPDEYAMRVKGDCLSPAIKEGDAVVVDKRLPYAAGDLVVIYMRPELVGKGEMGIYVKRLVMSVAPYVKFPWREHPDSTVHVVVIIEQDNPRRQYVITADRILAMHRCLGVAGAEVRLVKPAKVAAGFEAEQEEATTEDTRTVAELCRQWRIVKAKLSYDIALLPEHHPDADLDSLCDAAYDGMHAIEAELASRKLLTPQELYEVQRIALDNLSDEASTVVEENDIGLLRTVRLGLAWMLPPANKPQAGDAAGERRPGHDNEGIERIPGEGP